MRVYITFGQVHVHSCQGLTIDKDCVVMYECADEAAGRQRAFALFGNQWHQCYTRFDQVNLDYFPRGIFQIS